MWRRVSESWRIGSASRDLRNSARSRCGGNVVQGSNIATGCRSAKKEEIGLANRAEVALPALDRSLIAGVAAFQGLTPEQHDDVLSEAQSGRYPKGTDVFRQDSEA